MRIKPSSRRRHRQDRIERVLGAAVPLLALLVAACESQGGNLVTEPPIVAGQWSGTVTLDAGTHSMSATLMQQDFVVTGRATVQDHFTDLPLEAGIDANNRLVTLVLNECEAWSGLLDISDDWQALEGPVLIDRATCPTGQNEVGQIRLDRQ